MRICLCGRKFAMPEVQWQRRFDEPEKETEEIANMDRTDYEVLLAEIEQR